MFIKLLTSTVLIKLLDPDPNSDPNANQEQKFRIRFRLKKLGSSRIRIRNTGILGSIYGLNGSKSCSSFSDCSLIFFSGIGHFRLKFRYSIFRYYPTLKKFRQLCRKVLDSYFPTAETGNIRLETYSTSCCIQQSKIFRGKRAILLQFSDCPMQCSWSGSAWDPGLYLESESRIQTVNKLVSISF